MVKTKKRPVPLGGPAPVPEALDRDPVAFLVAPQVRCRAQRAQRQRPARPQLPQPMAPPLPLAAGPGGVFQVALGAEAAAHQGQRRAQDVLHRSVQLQVRVPPAIPAPRPLPASYRLAAALQTSPRYSLPLIRRSMQHMIKEVSNNRELRPLEWGLDINAAMYKDGKRTTPNGDVRLLLPPPLPLQALPSQGPAGLAVGLGSACARACAAVLAGGHGEPSGCELPPCTSSSQAAAAADTFAPLLAAPPSGGEPAHGGGSVLQGRHAPVPPAAAL
jgi:hypothetical protein